MKNIVFDLNEYFMLTLQAINYEYLCQSCDAD